MIGKANAAVVVTTVYL